MALQHIGMFSLKRNGMNFITLLGPIRFKTRTLYSHELTVYMTPLSVCFCICRHQTWILIPGSILALSPCCESWRNVSNSVSEIQLERYLPAGPVAPVPLGALEGGQTGSGAHTCVEASGHCTAQKVTGRFLQGTPKNTPATSVGGGNAQDQGSGSPHLCWSSSHWEGA